MVIDIDDEDSQRLLRLFNDPAGLQYLKEEAGVDGETLSKLSWLGISGIANVLCCIKMAKYYELTENDVVGTVLTDSAVMYKSRIEELNEMHGAYNAHEAALDHNLHMLGLKTDSMMEMGYAERKRVHLSLIHILDRWRASSTVLLIFLSPYYLLLLNDVT